MASPVPYANPLRRSTNRKTLRFHTAQGSFIYSPVKGKVIREGNNAVIVSENKYRHELTNVKVKEFGSVRPGQRIGYALKHKVVYTKKDPDGQIVDAMVSVKRDNGPRPTLRMKGVPYSSAHGEPGEMGPGDELTVVWHTSESGNDEAAIHGIANWVKQQQSEYTIIWNPYTGQFLQLFPANVGARAVQNGWTIAANRHGKIRIQVCVVGRAANKPLVKSPMKGRRRLMEWLDSWGVPRKFSENPNNPDRSIKHWTESGHTTHAAAPEPNNHTDPGPIDVNRLFGP